MLPAPPRHSGDACVPLFLSLLAESLTVAFCSCRVCGKEWVPRRGSDLQCSVGRDESLEAIRSAQLLVPRGLD